MKKAAKQYNQEEIVQQCIRAFKAGSKPDMVPREFLGAFKQGHRKGVQEFIDEDLSYVLLEKVLLHNDKEARKALEWTTKYNNEYYRGVLKKNDPDAIHNTPELYKEATDAHNARKRDLMAEARSGKPAEEGKIGLSLVSWDASGRKGDHVDSSFDENIHEQFMNQNRDLNHEDVMVDYIDAMNNPKKKD